MHREQRKLVLELERKRLDLSQAKLAQRADLHPSTVSNIETGNLRPWSGQRVKIETAMREAGWNGEGDLFEEVGE
jgi:transcriptional regulator with XRE-family HTH domain